MMSRWAFSATSSSNSRSDIPTRPGALSLELVGFCNQPLHQLRRRRCAFTSLNLRFRLDQRLLQSLCFVTRTQELQRFSDYVFDIGVAARLDSHGDNGFELRRKFHVHGVLLPQNITNL